MIIEAFISEESNISAVDLGCSYSSELTYTLTVEDGSTPLIKILDSDNPFTNVQPKDDFTWASDS